MVSLSPDHIVKHFPDIVLKDSGRRFAPSDLIEACTFVEPGQLRLVLAITPETAPLLETIKSIYTKAAEPFGKTLQFLVTQHRSPAKGPALPQKLDLPTIKSILAVVSGKGGVGKSMVAVNLAFALAAEGLKVGLLDLDIYGPSLPLMTGLGETPRQESGKFIPFERDGVKLLSMGMLVPAEKAMIWRGPLIQKAVLQLLGDTHWGDLDVLILDTPPGTGDVHLTLTQSVPLKGVLIVSTPQELALIDARKSYDMFKTMDIPLWGLVENMSSFTCPHCAEQTALFPENGARSVADRLGLPLLGQIPFSPAIRQSADLGAPAFLDKQSSVKHLFVAMAKMLRPKISS